MRIEVTHEDLIDGSRQCSWACPLALAIARACPHSEPWVGGCGTVLCYDKVVVLPNAVNHFVEAFDRGKPVSPFAFELDITHE